MRLLVIDDDEDVRELLRFCLARDLGAEISEAAGGAEGIDKARMEGPDAILLDLNMPEMDGQATLAGLRGLAETAGIPVVFLTAEIRPEEVERLRSLGALGVIAKPFNHKMVATELSSMLAPRVAGGGLDELRARFVRRSGERFEQGERLLDGLRGALARGAADAARGGLRETALFFHSLAGAGASHGYPRTSALAGQAERECSRLLHQEQSANTEQIESWRASLDGCRSEILAKGAAAAGPPSPQAVTYRGPTAAEVLLVDDDPELLEMVSRILKPRGMVIRALRTCAEAWKAIQEHRPDGALIDIRLPDGSGYQLVEQLRALPAGDSVAVIVVSVLTGFLDKVEAIRCGADAYFEKPVDWEALGQRLQQLLERHHTPRSRVLSVEDDPDQAAIIQSILESGGHEVACCPDPAELASALSSFRPDLLLLDVNLPGTSGYELARYLRQDERHATLPIVFLTRGAEIESRIRGVQAGGDDHLSKPVTPGLLLSTVAARIERARFLRRLLYRDGLTHLLSHAAFFEQLKALVAYKRRQHQSSVALAMLDLDHFKTVNDRHGHPVGDRVLVALSTMLRRRVRHSDLIGRYGGEEFILVLEDLVRDDALRLLRRLLDEFSAIEHHPRDGPPFRVTFSAGVAMFDPDSMDADGWVQAADDALYLAKAGGRNRVAAIGGP